MKLRMIATALILIIGSAAISTNTDAAPWRGRGGWGYRGGIIAPPIVRVGLPVPVIAPGVCIAPPVIGAPVAVGGYYGGYGRPYYRGGYEYRGGYGYRGGYRGYRR